MDPAQFLRECATKPALVIATVLACIGTSGAGFAAATGATSGNVAVVLKGAQPDTPDPVATNPDAADQPVKTLTLTDLGTQEATAHAAHRAEREKAEQVRKELAEQERLAAERAAKLAAEAEAAKKRAAAEAKRKAAAEAAAKKAAAEKAARDKAAKKRAEKERKTPATGTALDAQKYAKARMASKYNWGAKEFTCLLDLWNKESRWKWNAKNPNSSAYGIPQSLPGKKMASAGKDWRTNYKTQVNWGLDYIKGRYGKPCAAWDHSVRKNWY